MDIVYDPLVGQNVVDSFGSPEAHAKDSIFCHETDAFDIDGFGGSEELEMACREEVGVDCVAEFSWQLGQGASESCQHLS